MLWRTFLSVQLALGALLDLHVDGHVEVVLAQVVQVVVEVRQVLVAAALEKGRGHCEAILILLKYKKRLLSETPKNAKPRPQWPGDLNL